MYSQISASRVSEYLAGLRKGDDGISAQTSNFYLTALKSFCRFMVKDRRATENPVAHLDGLNVATDRRHDRRHLTADELSRLIQTTTTGPIRHKLDGFSRAILYRVAMETGLRRKELRELSVGSFDFDSPTPSVMLEAGKSKNRKVTVLPVRPQLVEELRRWFATLPDAPETRLWPTLTQHTAKMLKADLEAAGIVYVDDAGLFADFHSLRHSFVSMLAAGNVHPKLAQRLARHSDINLTMNRYSHTLLTDEAEALKALPEFPSAFTSERPEVQTLKATGTDGRGENVLPSGLPFSDAFQCISMHQGDIPNPEMPTRSKNEKPLNPSGKTKKIRGSLSGEAGIRTLGPLAETPVFKTGAIGRSATSPGY